MSGGPAISLGIIGLGGAGRAHHARFSKKEGVGRILGYDVKKRDYPGIETIYDFAEFLSKVDAVSICSPDDDHFGDIVTCLEKGKHVLVEKPMVASLAEALKLRETLARHPGRVFAVHHQMRFVPAFFNAKRLIDSGALGRIFYVEANYWHDMRARSTMYDDWRMDTDRKGQSVIFGHGCHTYDLILFLLGDYPVEHRTYVNKTGFSDYPQPYTAATTVFRFGNGTIAKSHVNNCCVFPQLNNLIVLGDEGSYIDGALYKAGRFETVVDFFPRRNYLREPPRSFVRPLLNRLRDPGHLVFSAARKTQQALQWYFGRKGLWRQHPLTVYNHELACDRVVDNFIAAITNGEAVLVGHEEALRVIRLCEELENDAAASVGVMGSHSA